MKTILYRQLLMTLVPSLAVLAVTAAAVILFDVSIPAMTRDAAALAQIPPLWGIVSNLGILLWCAAVAICVFAAVAVFRAGPRDAFRFLLFSALLTAYLLFDDFFQFHENIAPRHLGLNEHAVVAAQALQRLRIWQRSGDSSSCGHPSSSSCSHWGSLRRLSLQTCFSSRGFCCGSANGNTLSKTGPSGWASRAGAAIMRPLPSTSWPAYTACLTEISDGGDLPHLSRGISDSRIPSATLTIPLSCISSLDGRG